MGRQLDELYGDRLAWVSEHTVSDQKIGNFGLFEVHYDRLKILDGCASCRATVEFARRFAFPGIYGLTDPLHDRVVYVGRSVNIGARFGQHLRGEEIIRYSTKRGAKHEWVFDLLTSGQKPGLVVLSRTNTAHEELRFIQGLKPQFNTVSRMAEPKTESQRFHAERKAQKEALKARHDAEDAEYGALGRQVLKDQRRELKGFPVTQAEIERRRLYEDTHRRRRDDRTRRVGFPPPGGWV